MNYSQGTAYSCQTIAAVGAIANNALGLKVLQDTCKPLDEAFEVIFRKYPHIKIRVDSKELTDWTDENLQEREQDFNERIKRIKAILPPEQFHWILPRLRPPYVSGDRQVRVFELAYAKLMIKLHPSTYPKLVETEGSQVLSLYQDKNFHHDPAIVLNDITNWPVKIIVANGGNKPELSKSFSEENKIDHSVSIGILSELAAISINPEKYVAVASSVGEPGNSFVYLDPGSFIVPYHDFIISSVDANKKSISIRDPFNSRIELVLKYDDFLQYFNTVSIATVSA